LYIILVGAAHILSKMERAKISHGLWQLCAVQVEHLNQVSASFCPATHHSVFSSGIYTSFLSSLAGQRKLGVRL